MFFARKMHEIESVQEAVWGLQQVESAVDGDAINVGTELRACSRICWSSRRRSAVSTTPRIVWRWCVMCRCGREVRPGGGRGLRFGSWARPDLELISVLRL